MWSETVLAILSFCLLVHQHVAQRPPGVPDPNIQQMQQEQPHQHQQQPPQQQQYQQVHAHQGAQGAQAGHGHQGGFGQQPHDADHIKEHLKDVAKPKDEMTEEELEFHYFKLHDYDNNNKLDGTEITKAITHFHADEEEGEEAKPQAKTFADDEIANIVDMVLKEDDLNNDGYIEYAEFITAQRKARDNLPIN